MIGKTKIAQPEESVFFPCGIEECVLFYAARANKSGTARVLFRTVDTTSPPGKRNHKTVPRHFPDGVARRETATAVHSRPSEWRRNRSTPRALSGVLAGNGERLTWPTVPKMMSGVARLPKCLIFGPRPMPFGFSSS